MKNNNMKNKTHVSIPGVACGIALMPMKEVYELMYDDVVNAHNTLAAAKSAKIIRNVLQEIYEYPVDNRVSEKIRHLIADIKGSVHAMHMHDYTRHDMCCALETLMSALRTAIEEEEHNEVVEDARRTFLLMADHAEEFVDWLTEMHRKQ